MTAETMKGVLEEPELEPVVMTQILDLVQRELVGPMLDLWVMDPRDLPLAVELVRTVDMLVGADFTMGMSAKCAAVLFQEMPSIEQSAQIFGEQTPQWIANVLGELPDKLGAQILVPMSNTAAAMGLNLMPAAVSAPMLLVMPANARVARGELMSRCKPQAVANILAEWTDEQAARTAEYMTYARDDAMELVLPLLPPLVFGKMMRVTNKSLVANHHIMNFAMGMKAQMEAAMQALQARGSRAALSATRSSPG
jgi:hypothetical protein